MKFLSKPPGPTLKLNNTLIIKTKEKKIGLKYLKYVGGYDA